MPPSLSKREGGSSQQSNAESGPSNGFRRTAEDKARRRLAEGTLGHADAAEQGLTADDDGSRGERFALDLPGNRFRELDQLRATEMKDAIRKGLIQDPEKRTSLDNAIEFRGTCTDMCPAYEREEREYKRHLHTLEMRSGEEGKGRVDPAKAVTIYHRPAAGISQPLPSDVRTPATLKNTLDYLFHKVLTLPSSRHPELTPEAASLLDVHGFVRDRTRGIRQDFSFQRSWGNEENVEAHERIARFHILSMYELGKVQEKADPSWLKQEAEQLNKTLITLIELYDDQRLEGRTYPNEPEFRAYQVLSHLNDNEVARAILDLPNDIFGHPLLQLAFDFRALAQRNFDTQKVGRGYNTEMSLNFATRFFKLVNHPKVPYLIACLAHNKFGEVRRAGMRALTRAYARTAPPNLQANGQPKGLALKAFKELMGCTDEVEVAEVAKSLDITLLSKDGETDTDSPPVTALVGPSNSYNDNADAPVANPYPQIGQKRSGFTYQQIIDGVAGTASAVIPQAQRPIPPAVIHRSAQRYTPSPIIALTPPTANPFPVTTLKATAIPFAPTFQPAPIPPAPALTTPKPLAAAVTPQPRDRAASRTSPSIAAVPSFPALTTTTPKSTPPPRIAPIRPSPNTIPFNVTKGPPSPGLRGSVRKSSVKKRPSPTQVAATAKSITSKLIARMLETEVSMVIQQALSEEAELDSAKRTLVVSTLSQHITADVERAFLKQAFAELYQEVRIAQVQALCFRHWARVSRLRTEENARLLEQRIEKEKQFRSEAANMDLGASTMTRLSNGHEGRISHQRMSGLLPDQGKEDEEDAVQVLADIAKRKAILETGTFWSVFGNHVMQIPSEDEPIVKEQEEDASTEVDLGIVIDVSDTSQGNWLRRKFNMEGVSRYTAHFEAHGMRSGYITMEHIEVVEKKMDPATCLAVFECPRIISEADRLRFRRLVGSLPRRKRFRNSLLVITWRPISLEAFWREIGLEGEISPFWTVHIQDMSIDATDEAFSNALEQVMVTLPYNPRVEIPIGSFVELLRPGWEELCAFARTVVERNRDDFERLGKIAWALVGGLVQVRRILVDVLVGLDVSTDILGELDFGGVPVDQGAWRDAGATRSSLAKLVDPQSSSVGPAIAAIAPNIRSRLEQYFDEPSEIILPLVHEIANATLAHYSAQTISLYTESIPEAEMAALHARKGFEEWVEGCRIDIARSSVPARVRTPSGTMERGSGCDVAATSNGAAGLDKQETPGGSGSKGKKRSFSAASIVASDGGGDKSPAKRTNPSAGSKSVAKGRATEDVGTRVEKLAKAIADAKRALGR